MDFSKSPAIQEMPVISAICSPRDSDTVEVKNGKIEVKGKNKNDTKLHAVDETEYFKHTGTIKTRL